MGKICCFAGHSDIYETEAVYKKLLSEIENLVIKEKVNEFLVGNYGGFDALCTRAIREIKKAHPDILLNLTIPYITARINSSEEEYNKRFDLITVADIPENTPRRLKIIKCNQYMVNKADFLICYICRSYGGAAKTLEYAQKKKDVEIINLASPC